MEIMDLKTSSTIMNHGEIVRSEGQDMKDEK